MYDDEVHQVGYGRPPKNRRFREGVSGNPRGRPKGSKNLATTFRKITQEKVQVNGPQGPRMITKLEAGITQLANRAAKGDTKAIRELIHWARVFGDGAANASPPVLNVHFVKALNGKPIKEDLG